MRYVYSDGGRSDYKHIWDKRTGDCAVVAFAHILDKTYEQVRLELEELRGEPYSKVSAGTKSDIIRKYGLQHDFYRYPLDAPVSESRLNPAKGVSYLFANETHIWAVIDRVAYDSFPHYKFQVSEVYCPADVPVPRVSPGRLPDRLDHPIQIEIFNGIISVDNKKIGELSTEEKPGWYKVRNSIKKWDLISPFEPLLSEEQVKRLIFATWNRSWR